MSALPPSLLLLGEIKIVYSFNVVINNIGSRGTVMFSTSVEIIVGVRAGVKKYYSPPYYRNTGILLPGFG